MGKKPEKLAKLELKELREEDKMSPDLLFLKKFRCKLLKHIRNIRSHKAIRANSD